MCNPNLKTIALILLIHIQGFLVYGTTISPTDPAIHYFGRFNNTDPERPRMYWSGSHIITWFEGTSCSLILDSQKSEQKGNDYFNIIINNEEPRIFKIELGEQEIEVASQLEEGIHKIEIYKRTSYQIANTALIGIRLDEGKELVSKKLSKDIIEFYGDSITDGHSVDAPWDNGSPEYWNNYRTFAAVTSRNLGMQPVCIAASGIAVKNPWMEGFVMKNYWDIINPGLEPPIKWDFEIQKPKIVVINLLQNDFRVQERIRHIPEETIFDAYEDLLRNVRAVYPNLHIICTLGSMNVSASEWSSHLKNLIRNLKEEGDSKLHTIIFDYKNTPGHPRAMDHKVMAEKLTEYIETNLSHLL